ncbi:hypothetical protein [Caballeronia sp. LZ001]|uniref:hypothetical protein n=1 Tax=Caballeronia sp. LZ001 TaxID=3038553 RepID=UPI00286222F2|nr:hypothetical protein [Caballeronia sp. LZ001]MDR5802123.1 hypothetical protein [Caballeronia sp. LZ001]
MSTWGDVAATVAKVAPILGNILPGVGTVAGLGVGAAASIVASALGVSADPDSVMSALKSDPDALVKVRTAELDNQTQLANIAMQREQNSLAAQTAQYQADAADRASARNLASEDKDHTARNLAYLYTGALFAVIGAHLFIIVQGVAVDAIAMSLISTLEGVLISMVLGSKEFYFGSSSAAVKQQAAITNFATAPGAVTAAAGDTTTVQTPTDSQQTVTVGPADNTYKGH